MRLSTDKKDSDCYFDYLNVIQNIRDNTITQLVVNQIIRRARVERIVRLKNVETRYLDVTTLIVLKNGTMITGHASGAIGRWDLQKGTCLSPSSHEHTGSINALVELPDGTVVSASSDSMIKHWDFKTNKRPADTWGWFMTRHSSSVDALAVCNDGTVVSGSADQNIKRWDPKTGKCIATWKSNHSIYGLTVLDDGSVMSIGPGIAQQWVLKSGELINNFIAENAYPFRGATVLAVLKNGVIFVRSVFDRDLFFWDPRTDNFVFGAEKYFLEAMKDGTYIANSQNRILIKVSDKKTGSCIQSWRKSWGLNLIHPLSNGTVVEYDKYDVDFHYLIHSHFPERSLSIEEISFLLKEIIQKQNTSIQEIDLRHTPLDDSSFYLLRELISTTKIKVLDIRDTQISLIKQCSLMVSKSSTLEIRADAQTVEEYRKAAEEGDIKAQIMLGDLYDNGVFSYRGKHEAVTWYEKAAMQGDAKTQTKLGIYYKTGTASTAIEDIWSGTRTTTSDYIQAVQWFRRAADQNDQEAQRYLQSPELKPIHLLLVFAEENDGKAYFELGLMYEKGVIEGLLFSYQSQIVPQNSVKAQNYFQKAVELKYIPAQQYLLAKEFTKQHQYAEALLAYEEALRSDPKCVMAWVGKGNVLIHLDLYKNNEEALAAYESALASDPKCAEAHCGRGDILLCSSRFEEAREAFEAAQNDFCLSIRACIGKGDALLWAKPEKALDCYEEVLSGDPNNSEALLGKGHALLGTYSNSCSAIPYRPQEALDTFEKALQLDHKRAENHLGKARALQALERNEEALASLELTLQLEPPPKESSSKLTANHKDSQMQARVAKGEILLDLRRYEEALVVFEKCPRAVGIVGGPGVVGGIQRARQALGLLDDDLKDNYTPISLDESDTVSSDDHYRMTSAGRNRDKSRKSKIHRNKDVDFRSDGTEFSRSAYVSGVSRTPVKKEHWKEKALKHEQKSQKNELKADKLFDVSFVISYSELILGKEIGRGGYGVVHEATWRGSVVAIKKLLSSTLSKETADEFNKEVKIMAQLRHENVVQFKGYCSNPRCLVMEYMPKGSLFGLLHGGQALTPDLKRRFIVDIAKGLSFLHASHILHRDLKSLNILLDEFFRAKISDFGLSKVKSETRGMTMKGGAVGTPAWTAPELAKRGAEHTSKADIFSFAVVMWEIYTRKVPFADAPNPGLVMMWIVQGDREKIPEDCPKKVASLITACWKARPDERPDASEIVEYLNSSREEFESKSSAMVSAASVVRNSVTYANLESQRSSSEISLSS